MKFTAALFAAALAAATAAPASHLATSLRMTADAAERCQALPTVVCVLAATAGNGVGGTVVFAPEFADAADCTSQYDKNECLMRATGTISGLGDATPHGWHIHTFGDMRKPDGTGTGSHYNPANVRPASFPPCAMSLIISREVTSTSLTRLLSPLRSHLKFFHEQVTHALPPAAVRHVGDLGNLTPSPAGVATVDELYTGVSTADVVGRGLIVHANEDTGAPPVGAAGARLAQCVIGFANTA
jgi:superoxide dismutase, Cu-Zn family